MTEDDEDFPPCHPAQFGSALYEAMAKKAERAEIALRFAVAAYGGAMAYPNCSEVDEMVIARRSFEMADAFIAARDGAS